jgi:predicted aspartyl protease
MIQGKFDDIGHIFFEIDLITPDGSKFPVEAMLDTGFTGLLAISDQDLDALQWAYIGEEEMITAGGNSNFNKYLGKISIDREEYEIPAFAGDEITEVLLGSAWLKILPLVVNYQAGILTLGD